MRLGLNLRSSLTSHFSPVTSYSPGDPDCLGWHCPPARRGVKSPVGPQRGSEPLGLPCRHPLWPLQQVSLPLRAHPHTLSCSPFSTSHPPGWNPTRLWTPEGSGGGSASSSVSCTYPPPPCGRNTAQCYPPDLVALDWPCSSLCSERCWSKRLLQKYYRAESRGQDAPPHPWPIHTSCATPL